MTPAVVKSKLVPSTATVAELFPRVVTPVEDKVVNAPVDGVVVPIAVVLIPVAVVLKLEAVIVKAFAPVLMEEADNPESARAPDVAVKFNAPVVRVRLADAVSSPAEVIVPVEVVEILLGDVSPEVAVISPEIVGVTVQDGVPLDSRVSTPDVFPIVVADEPVELMSVVPKTVVAPLLLQDSSLLPTASL